MQQELDDMVKNAIKKEYNRKGVLQNLCSMAAKQVQTGTFSGTAYDLRDE
jgi:hypothetical protein